MFKITSLAIISAIVMWGCKGGDNEVEALRLPDTLTVTSNKPLGSGSKRVETRPLGENKTGKVQKNQSSSNAGQLPDGSGTSVPLGALPSGGVKWWDYKSVFLVDYMGGSGGYLYESVKGQRYFPETKIFVYSTNVSMEGTAQYGKIENTLESTELDDRIFIWVHLDANNKPVFKKVLISDNIKDKIDQAPLMIE